MSLELSGITTGNVRKYECHADASNDGKVANVSFEVRLSEIEASALGGKLFASSCFNDFVGGSSEVTCVSKKFGGELRVKSEHTVVIAGYPLETKPAVVSVSLGGKERTATVAIKISLPGSLAKLRGVLEQSVGGDVEMEFKGAAQPDLPGTPDDEPVAPEDDDRHGFDAVQE